MISNQKIRNSLDAKGPVWLPASTYYALGVAISIAFFFLLWDVLGNDRDDMPWLTAGLGSGALLFAAAVFREIVVRRTRNRRLYQQRKVESRDSLSANKLTIERNNAILDDIRRKSGAAKVLNKLSAAHREVFELCSEYLARNEGELATVNAGSPRLAPLLRGRTEASEFHRYHILQWAEIEARSLTSSAKNRAKTSEKIEAGQNALEIIDSAMEYYPTEVGLIESRKLVVDLVASIRLADWVERAERAVSTGDYPHAISLYSEALFYLGRHNDGGLNTNRAMNRIAEAIERVKNIESGAAHFGNAAAD